MLMLHHLVTGHHLVPRSALIAIRAGLDFVFIHGWTEFADWQEYSVDHGFPVVQDVGQLWPIFSDGAVAQPQWR